MAKIIWTAEAVRWLQEIHDFIAEDNPDAAIRPVTAIFDRSQLLSTFPEIGYRYRQDRRVRVLLYGHYRIAYLVKPAGDIDYSACSTVRSTSRDISSDVDYRELTPIERAWLIPVWWRHVPAAKL